jgi:hypothetical protein
VPEQDNCLSRKAVLNKMTDKKAVPEQRILPDGSLNKKAVPEQDD